MKTTLFYTSIICAAITMCMLMFISKCMKEIPKHGTSDSLLFVNKTLEAQLGYALADAQMQSERAVRAENKARQRDTIYLTRTKIIRQFAPDTCQPYLDAMGKECDTLILMHVQARMAKDTLITKKDAVIELYAAKDSTSQLVIGEQVKQLKESEKEVRKQKRGKVVAWCVGVGLGILYIITNTF